ncbi:hypothetical protein Golob_011201 [Gossypium lobatum]|uniref:RNase H type-1 domain-containing protein n=1 Tax=Gossypium lobatum TaxID=34289 RepID=A0A7J8MNR2_9ROSI|nr:hypothetical protein [Gossypium lobatum]
MARLGREHGIRKRPFGSYRGSSKDLSIFESSFGSFLKPGYSQMWKGDVWDKLLPLEKRTRFYSGSVHEWIIKIALCSKILPGVWRLSSKFSTVGPGDMLPLQRHSHNSRIPLASSPLARNWVCLSTDGSVKIEDDFAAAVGLLRGSNGAWIFGFYRYIGNCSVMDVELWGILDGSQLSLDKDFQCDLIQIDSLETVVAIQEDLIECHKSTLIRRIQ